MPAIPVVRPRLHEISHRDRMRPQSLEPGGISDSFAIAGAAALRNRYATRRHFSDGKSTQYDKAGKIGDAKSYCNPAVAEAGALADALADCAINCRNSVRSLSTSLGEILWYEEVHNS